VLNLKRTTLILLFILFVSFTIVFAVTNKEYFPFDTWRTSSPEAQGINSDTLNAVMNNVIKQSNTFHGIIIVRNGYTVMESYFYPYNATNKHHLHSVTKSVLSALIGIAIHEGFIKSVDQKVSDYFPEWQKPGADRRKGTITIADLLSMRSGFQWQMSDDDIWYNHSVQDLAGYILNKPIINATGKDFIYNTGNSQLLSMIIQKATGKSASDYAREKLFQPLGITDYDWKTTDDGYSYGGTKLYLKLLDMAKFGYLYLMQGKWGKNQVIPAAWVKESTEMKVKPTWASYGRPYAYHWWGQNFPGYSARGAFGQSIFVIPEANMVVITTADLPLDKMWDILDDMVQLMLPDDMIKSKPLPENPKAYSNLLNTLKTLNNYYLKSIVQDNKK
jgi:CubicO group peptidase (beta-lactamase class C family)